MSLDTAKGGIPRSSSAPNFKTLKTTNSGRDVVLNIEKDTEQTSLLFKKNEGQEPTNTAKACNYVTTFVVTTVITAGIVCSAYYNPYETAGFLFGGGLVAWCCCCVRPNPSTGFYSDSIR